MSTYASSSGEPSSTGQDTPVDVPPSLAERPIAHAEDDIPRMELWLWVLLSAFVPGLLALFLPRSFMGALFVISGGLIVAGVALFATQEWRKRHRRS